MPGQHFQLDDGSPSPIGNLHMGIYNAANARPHPDPAGVEPRELVRWRARPCASGSSSATTTRRTAILATAEKLGATILWRDHYWAEFNGFNGAFQDPWGNTLVLWTKGGDEPADPRGLHP